MITGTLLGGILGYLFHFLVSRQVSVAQYGELQSLLSVFVIFGVFNSALSYFVIKHTSVFAAHNDHNANREFAEYSLKKVSKFTLAALFVFFVASPILAKILHFSSAAGFVFISLATFFSTMAVVYQEILRGWQQFLLLSIVGIAAALVKFVSGVSLAFFSHKASVISLSFLISALASWYLMKYFCQKKILGKKDIREESASWRKKYFSETNVRKSAAGIFFFSTALVLVSNLDMVLVKYFSSPETAGYYGAFALLGKIVLWLNLAVVSVMLPGACADGHFGKRPDKKNLLQSYGLMSLIGSGLILIYYFAPDLVINSFFGKKYLLNTEILWLFGAMFFLLSILTLEANLSFAKHDFRVVYFLAATVFLMVAGLVKYHSSLEQIVSAFSVSFLAGYLLVTILNLSHEKRRLSATNL